MRADQFLYVFYVLQYVNGHAEISRIFIWLESSFTLNFVSEPDPDEMVQTHMLS